jgi:SAM-dependent methyltransferase
MRVGTVTFRRCRGCASLFVADPPPQSATADLYTGEEYFANPRFGTRDAGAFHGYRDYLADRVAIEAKFDQVLERVERHVAPGRLLDVGAGPGLLLAVARARGWRPEGIEPNPWAAEHARTQIGVEVRVGTATGGGLDEASFGAVTMMDLIEHLAVPDAAVAEAARATRAGGVLAVLTPDAGSAVSRLLGRRWPELLRAPEHLVLFSVRGLRSLVERHGYRSLGWHSVGKASTVPTLVADVSPTAPGLARPLSRAVERSRLADRTISFDPHTKFCLYGQRVT